MPSMLAWPLGLLPKGEHRCFLLETCATNFEMENTDQRSGMLSRFGQKYI